MPRGELAAFPEWRSGQQGGEYPGTKRQLFVYTPHQLAALKESGGRPALLLCNDGEPYVREAGAVRACAVLDSLIHAGDLPVTVAVFVSPGMPLDCSSQAHAAADPRVLLQRQVEYDRCTDAYPRFLEREVLPFAERHAGVAFSREPRLRCVAGVSSGGSAAFNAA